MSFSTEKVAIKNKFSTWTETRVKWPGIPFQEPTVAWIAPNILNGDSFDATIGNPIQRRHVGVVSIQILDAENKIDGDTRIRQIADLLLAMFINANSRLTISATEYLDFSSPSLTPWQSLNGWQQMNLLVPYTRDLFS